MPNSLKFDRDLEIVLEDGTIIKGLRTMFTITRQIGGEISTANISIYNAAPEVRNSLLSKGTTFAFNAGYKKSISNLFKGVVRNSNSYREGPDIITQIFGADLNSIVIPFISKTFSNSKNLINLISDLASEAGIKIGEINIKNNNQVGSIVFLSNFRDIMIELSNSFNFNWHIFNGLLFVNDSKIGNYKKLVFEVSAKTGLLETPILTEKGVNVKMLLESSIRPMDIYDVKSGGVRLSQSALEFNSLVTTGFGRQQALEVIHSGDTHSNIWFTEIEGLRL